MFPNKILLKDIAKEAGVSVTTVSFILNNHAEKKGISKDVIKKVQEVIKKNNYIPNNLARSLRTGKTKSIGLIVEDIGNPFFGTFAKQIEIEANKKGYKVFYSSTDNNDTLAEELIRLMKNQRVDGFIITPTPNIKGTIEQLKREKVPFVLFDRYYSDIETNFVIVDNFKGSYKITHHLIKKGYKNIGFITLTSGMNQMQLRYDGYVKAMFDNHLNPTNFILPVNFKEPNKILLLDSFFKEHPNIDAVYFTTNYLGLQGLRYFNEKKIQIPSDKAFVCFDDHDAFQFHQPPITTIKQPIEKMAHEAISSLLKILENDECDGIILQKIIEPELIIRD